jgi:G:T/U-mismatch repair DNA glycosylase
VLDSVPAYAVSPSQEATRLLVSVDIALKNKKRSGKTERMSVGRKEQTKEARNFIRKYKQNPNKQPLLVSEELLDEVRRVCLSGRSTKNSIHHFLLQTKAMSTDSKSKESKEPKFEERLALYLETQDFKGLVADTHKREIDVLFLSRFFLDLLLISLHYLCSHHALFSYFRFLVLFSFFLFFFHFSLSFFPYSSSLLPPQESPKKDEVETNFSLQLIGNLLCNNLYVLSPRFILISL